MDLGAGHLRLPCVIAAGDFPTTSSLSWCSVHWTMDSLPDLAEKLDFSLGLKFQKEMNQLFRSSVHHPSSSPSGSFFLLVTFRRFTFRLTEDSVALALQSCLGGSGPGFH